MIKLIVFDIAGTTVRDNDEVLHCFRAACRQTGITAPDTRLNALMGVSKLEVFKILWHEQLGDEQETAVAEKSEVSYVVFQEILEDYYFHHKTLEEAGAKLGLSKSWTCRVHARALKSLAPVCQQRGLGPPG